MPFAVAAREVTTLLAFSPVSALFYIKGLTGHVHGSKMRPAFGDWRSLVAHFVRDEGVGGSNPLSPTKFRKTQPQGWVFCFLRPEEDEKLRGGGSTRAKRENVASATARRASHAVASHPLSPTKFRKTQPQGWVFCFLRLQNVTDNRFASSPLLRSRTGERSPRQQRRNIPFRQKSRLSSLPTASSLFCEIFHCIFLYIDESFFALLIDRGSIFRCAF